MFDNFLFCVEYGLEQNGRPPHLRRRGSQRTVGCLPPSVWGPSGRRGPPEIRLPPISWSGQKPHRPWALILALAWHQGVG